MPRKILSLCALLTGAIATTAVATTFPFTCNLGYEVSTSGSSALHDTPQDRVCAVEIVYSNGSGATTRTYSCTVAASTSSCTVTIDPSASSVPSGFSPTSAVTAPLHSSVEESNGCVYLIVDPFSTPPGRYPSATVLTMPSLEVVVTHYFDCTSVP